MQNRFLNFKSHLIQLCLVVVGLTCFGFVNAQSPKLSTSINYRVINRHLSINQSQGKSVLHLDAAEGAGVAWVDSIKIKNGTIEFDVRGKDVLQQSFVGMAFRRQNNTSYDCIYFRPFNFQSKDTVRKTHSVQYISLPQYDWQYLREKFPGKYENTLRVSVDPNTWFHVKVMIDGNEIMVYVNGDDKPSLTVKSLNNYITGEIGYWVGNNSEGDFANLSVTQHAD